MRGWGTPPHFFSIELFNTSRPSCLQVYLLWENSMPPSILQSDNGTEFCNGILNKLCEMFGIKHICGSVGHPQSQGAVERANKVVKDKLRAEIMRAELAGDVDRRCGGGMRLWGRAEPSISIDLNSPKAARTSLSFVSSTCHAAGGSTLCG